MGIPTPMGLMRLMRVGCRGSSLQDPAMPRGIMISRPAQITPSQRCLEIGDKSTPKKETKKTPIKEYLRGRESARDTKGFAIGDSLFFCTKTPFTARIISAFYSDTRDAIETQHSMRIVVLILLILFPGFMQKRNILTFAHSMAHHHYRDIINT